MATKQLFGEEEKKNKSEWAGASTNPAWFISPLDILLTLSIAMRDYI